MIVELVIVAYESAARTAVRVAHGLVLATPRSAMPAPRAATVHHTPCAAFVKVVKVVPPWSRAGPMIVPEMATPRVVPAWRPVEASEPARPAIERGIPEIAELVIGGFTAPRKIPNSR